MGEKERDVCTFFNNPLFYLPFSLTFSFFSLRIRSNEYNFLFHFSLLLRVVSLFLFPSKDMNTVLPITRYGSGVGWRATVIVHRSLVNLPFGSAGLLQGNYNDSSKKYRKKIFWTCCPVFLTG